MLALLEEAIKAYGILENTTYKITLGKLTKNQIDHESIVDLTIQFKSEHFFHLFGFQYLENLNADVNKKVMFKGLRTLVYKGQSLELNRYYDQIVSSPSFSSDVIKNRLEVIKFLPYFLDTFSKKNTYWKYSGFKGIVTEI